MLEVCKLDSQSTHQGENLPHLEQWIAAMQRKATAILVEVDGRLISNPNVDQPCALGLLSAGHRGQGYHYPAFRISLNTTAEKLKVVQIDLPFIGCTIYPFSHPFFIKPR